jgi:DNA-binding IclR family transcriptional regulator
MLKADKRNYTKISDHTRAVLIYQVEKEGRQLTKVARELDIPLSNAQKIVLTYRREGRVLQTPAQVRKYAKILRRDPEQL